MIWFPEHVAGGTGIFHVIATGISFSIITLLHVVLGELVPKSMAIQQAERVTLAITKPLRVFYACVKPLIRAFTALANVVLRRFSFHGLEESPLSEEELKFVMKESHEDGIISESEAQIINRAFSFSDQRVADIFIPESRVEFLSLSRTFEQNITVTKNKMHTRFPLAKTGFNSIVGVVHVKDVMHALPVDASNAAFEKAVRRHRHDGRHPRAARGRNHG